jgi:hypothetical protein
MSVDVTTCRCAEIEADVPIGILCVRCKAELTRLHAALEDAHNDFRALFGVWHDNGFWEAASPAERDYEASLRERAGLP